MEPLNFPEIFQNKLRLQIVSYLISGEKSFREVKLLTKASDGNISSQFTKLEEKNIVTIKKQFVNNKPRTTYKLTNYGFNQFKEYVCLLENILNTEKE